MDGGHTGMSPSTDSPVSDEASASKTAVPSSDPAFQNAPSSAGHAPCPITTTEIDGFSIEEVPNRATESTEQDHNRADDSFDWVIEGGEDLDGNTR